MALAEKSVLRSSALNSSRTFSGHSFKVYSASSSGSSGSLTTEIVMFFFANQTCRSRHSKNRLKKSVDQLLWGLLCVHILDKMPGSRFDPPKFPLKSMKPNYRRCISCRKAAPKTEFWRIVRLSPSHTVQLDSGMGRSAYICPHASCLQSAQKKNRLGRSLKVTVPEGIYQILWQRLEATARMD